jgi:hypothetical protein
MKERNQILIKLIVSHIILLPVLVLTSFIYRGYGFLLLSITQTGLLIIFLAGYWEFFSIQFKWVYSLSIEILIFICLLKVNSQFSSLPWTLCLMLGQLFLLIAFIRIILVIFWRDRLKLEILFPFHEGVYLVTDGGNSKISRLMNYHFHSPVHKKKNTNKSMLYATDIVRLDSNDRKFLSFRNEDYPCFGENLYSPINGRIAKVINDIEDNQPFSGNYPYNTGNTVVIKKDNLYFLLGHLKRGSIVVQEGETITANQLLGQAGNSGMSERPHLHMQLMQSDTEDYWKGTGYCIQFRNINLFKNRIIKIKERS